VPSLFEQIGEEEESASDNSFGEEGRANRLYPGVRRESKNQGKKRGRKELLASLWQTGKIHQRAPRRTH